MPLPPVTHINLIMNWFEELKVKVPTGRSRQPRVLGTAGCCRARQGRRAIGGEEGSVSTVEQNKALVRRSGEAMNARQLDLLDEIVAPDFVRHCQATPGIAVRSLQAFKAFLRDDTAAFPDSVQTLTHMVAEGDLVAVWVTYEGTQRGPMGPFPPSGKRMLLDFGAVLRVEGGKLAEMWVTWDNMAALTQLGHLPMAPTTNA
jgi:predicted ester cyclase